MIEEKLLVGLISENIETWQSFGFVFYGIGRQRKLLLPFWHHYDILFQTRRTLL